MATITVSSRIDSFQEALNLLLLLKENGTYDDMERKISKRLTGSKKEFQKKISLLKKIEKEALKQLKDKKEDMNYYFGNDYSEEKCPGEVVILWDHLRLHPHLTIDEARHILETMEDRHYYTCFAQTLYDYGNAIQDVSMREDVHIEDPIEIIRIIMDMEISQEDKWKLQDIFLYPAKHRNAVLSLLSIAEEAILKFQTELEAYADQFAQYWSEKTKEKTILEIVEEGIGYHFDENPLGGTLFPSLIIPNCFSIFAESKGNVLTTPYNIRMGFLFDDDFSLTFDTSSEDLYENYESNVVDLLKLLGDTSKFQILLTIKDQRAYGSELAKKLNLTTATISHHMSALASNGLVIIEKEDTKVFYKANQKKIEEVLQNCHTLLLEGKTNIES